MASKVKTLKQPETTLNWEQRPLGEDQQQSALVVMILIGHYLFIQKSFQKCMSLCLLC